LKTFISLLVLPNFRALLFTKGDTLFTLWLVKFNFEVVFSFVYSPSNMCISCSYHSMNDNDSKAVCITFCKLYPSFREPTTEELLDRKVAVPV
jgi:hypothetical protein